MKSSLRNMILSLTGLTVAIGAALAAVNEATADAIKETARRTRIEAMEAILPPFDNDIIATEVQSDGLPLYQATLGSEPVGIAIETYSDNGFSGRIAIITGFDNDGKLTGYRVLEHQETPGLGARMGEWFATAPHSVIGSSATLSVKNDGGDIDAITGATITSRAFLDAVNHARQAFQSYKK